MNAPCVPIPGLTSFNKHWLRFRSCLHRTRYVAISKGHTVPVRVGRVPIRENILVILYAVICSPLMCFVFDVFANGQILICGGVKLDPARSFKSYNFPSKQVRAGVKLQ